jgi:hypothetical protein
MLTLYRTWIGLSSSVIVFNKWILSTKKFGTQRPHRRASIEAAS